MPLLSHKKRYTTLLSRASLQGIYIIPQHPSRPDLNISALHLLLSLTPCAYSLHLNSEVSAFPPAITVRSAAHLYRLTPFLSLEFGILIRVLERTFNQSSATSISLNSRRCWSINFRKLTISLRHQESINPPIQCSAHTMGFKCSILPATQTTRPVL